jgi:hypothetical protein
MQLCNAHVLIAFTVKIVAIAGTGEEKIPWEQQKKYLCIEESVLPHNRQQATSNVKPTFFRDRLLSFSC